MSQALIRRAFESRLDAWAKAQRPVMLLAYENVSFTPPSTRYARAFLVPAETGSDDLARTHRKYRGFFQVSLVMPAGVGPGEGEALVASLDALFAISAPLLAGSLRIYLLAPLSAAGAIQEDDRYVIPCSVKYRADTI